MRTSTFLMTLFASIMSASPIQPRQSWGSDPNTSDPYRGITLYANILNPFTGVVYRSPAPVEIAKLTTMGSTALFKLSFGTGAAINVDVNSVDCRAYSDAAGTQPVGPVFNAAQPAVFSAPEDPVIIGSVLCNVV